MNGPLPLQLFRQRQLGTADLLPWAALVDDGVVLCKDGTLLAGWVLHGPDQDSISDEQWNSTAFRVNQLLGFLGDGWCLNVDVVRSSAQEYPEPEECHFPDPVSAAMDAERRRYFQGRGAQFSTTTLLFLGYQPPLRMKSRGIELLFSDSELSPEPTEVSSGIMGEYLRQLDSLDVALRQMLGAQRLRSQRVRTSSDRTLWFCPLLSHFRLCLAGSDHPTAVRVPPFGCYLDAVLGTPELHHGVTPHINGQYLSMVAIEGFPSQTLNGFLEPLQQQPLNYRWSTRFLCLDRRSALRELDKLRRHWQQKIRGLMDQVMQTSRSAIDRDAMAMADETEQAMGEVNGEQISFGYYTSVVELRHADRGILEEQTRFITNLIDDLGFAARVETLNATEAWLGSLPGNAIPNLRRPLLSTRNLADLMPLSSLWEGEPRHPCALYPPASPALLHCETGGASTFRLNLHVGDVGHALILGPTGAGKSTLLGLLAAQQRRYAKARVVIFDKDYSLYTLCQALGGQHIELAGSGLSFAPLQGIGLPDKRLWATRWVEMLAQLQLGAEEVTPRQREVIRQALDLLARGHSQTLSDLYASLGDETLKTALRDYTVDGGIGGLLDADSDNLRLTDFTVFETGDFMRWQDRHALPVLLYLFRRIEEALDGSPTLLLLEEAWSLLGHPMFAAQVEDWLRTMRKKNGAVVLVTQYLADLEKSGISAALRGLPTKLLLPNAQACDELNRPVYQDLGLSGPQIQQIAMAQPKREYFLHSPRGFRRFSLALGPYALAWLGASDTESVRQVKALERSHGENWRTAWLKERGVSHA